MEDAQSTIDSLRELNTKFILQIDKLRKENADIKAENIKLKQDKAEIEARFIKLEQNDKDTASENAELKARVAKLEQKQSQTDEKNNFIVKSDDDAKGIDQYSVNTISAKMKNSNDTPASNISDNTSNSDDVSNFDICQESENQYLTSSTLIGPKSSEDMEIDDFLDSTYKEKVSKEIIQSIREKKLRVQEKIITSQDTKSSLSVKGGQGLIQELFTPEPSLQESNILQNHTIEISETGGPGKSNIDEASQHLAQLCDKAFDAEDGANRANQEEILCWSIYGKDFRVQFNEIIKNSRGKIGEKKARSLLYDSITKQLSIIRKKRSQELGLHLPEISRDALRKKTQRAEKIYTLFEKIDNVGHQISAHPGKILPIPEDSAKAETNIDYDDVYFDEEFDDDVYFDDEVASRSDKVEPGQRSSSNQALSHDDSDRSHNNYSEEEMPDESDDDGCGGYNEYGESDRGYYYDLSSGKKTYKNSDYIISAY
ncbi:hypothetical protein C2G38_2038167 [Gigaspora rosea]|uniref:Uncharacterized protein n=1 Tax=Gigaspora rosea TaxID=44941 RepID=A0A397V6H3_9GLOM|nr:hypothetical protein C2G38_2038167 [Gigaspora rosea]